MMNIEDTVFVLVGMLDSIHEFLEFPQQMRELFSYYFGCVLDRFDLDHFYTVTVCANLIMLSYWKDFKNWEKLKGWKKGIIVSTGLGTVFFNFVCLLRLFGLIGF